MKRNEFPRQQNGPNSLKLQLHQTSSMTKMDQILSTTNAPKFPQQQQNGLNFLSTTHAPKFPQQHQNGLNALNNKCTKISSTTTSKWTKFSQQQMHPKFLNNSKMDQILSTISAPNSFNNKKLIQLSFLSLSIS
jgi:hypothetical protein